MCLSRSLHQFRAQICHKPWRAKSLRLAEAYTSYGAADKILRRLTAYEVYGGLWRRLGALLVKNKRRMRYVFAYLLTMVTIGCRVQVLLRLLIYLYYTLVIFRSFHVSVSISVHCTIMATVMYGRNTNFNRSSG